MARNYYAEIDKVVSEYEQNKPWHTRDINWAANRVDWCWKWRKITKEQMEELADRITTIFEGDTNV
jgi:hypothetical protein